MTGSPVETIQQILILLCYDTPGSLTSFGIYSDYSLNSINELDPIHAVELRESRWS